MGPYFRINMYGSQRQGTNSLLIPFKLCHELHTHNVKKVAVCRKAVFVLGFML